MQRQGKRMASEYEALFGNKKPRTTLGALAGLSKQMITARPDLLLSSCGVGVVDATKDHHTTKTVGAAPPSSSLASLLSELNNCNNQTTTTKAQSSFPERLMDLLQRGVASSAMWFIDNGDAICIMPKPFQEQVLDVYFQATKFESFTRKLNRWGFKRLTGQRIPAHAVAYFHPSFRQSYPQLLKKMTGGKKSKVPSPTETMLQEQLRRDMEAARSLSMSCASSTSSSTTRAPATTTTAPNRLFQPLALPVLPTKHTTSTSTAASGGCGSGPDAALLRSLLVSQKADLLASLGQMKEKQDISRISLQSSLLRSMQNSTRLSSSPLLPPVPALATSSSPPAGTVPPPPLQSSSSSTAAAASRLATDHQLLQFLVLEQKKKLQLQALKLRLG